MVLMKKITACFLLIAFSFKATAQQIALLKQQSRDNIKGAGQVTLFNSDKSETNKTVSLIPVPVSLKINKGNFLLRRTTQLLINTNNAEVTNVVDQFSKKIELAT